jgi:hypothetical protein
VYVNKKCYLNYYIVIEEIFIIVVEQLCYKDVCINLISIPLLFYIVLYVKLLA